MNNRGSDDGSEVSQGTQVKTSEGDEPILAKVPEWVVVLGAGFLFTAALISLIGTLGVTYLLVTRNYTGVFTPIEQFDNRLILVEIQLLFATLFQLTGVYLARRRTHWGLVLISCLIGSFLVITIPFTGTAFILLGLGKYHFSLNMPSD